MSKFNNDFRSKPREGIWYSLNRFVLTLIVLSAAVRISYAFLPEVKNREEQKKTIEKLHADIESQQMLLNRREREEQLLLRNTEYIGILARDRLDLMKEGETIYRLDAR